MSKGKEDKAAKDTRMLIEVIGAMFEGQHPAVIGAALADLTSIWIAGHHPIKRGDVLALHIEAVAKLLPINAKRIAQQHNLDPETWTGCGTSNDATHGASPWP